MEIVDVLGLSVKPVVVNVLHAAEPEPEIVQVPLPMSKVRVLLLLEEKEPAVTLKFAAVNVPWVRVSVFVEPNVIASASVTVIPEPLIVVLPRVLPALVTVPLARKLDSILV